MTSNNVTRLLDAHHIKYQVFDLPPEKLGGMETARLLGVETSMVFKTIVFAREKPGKPILAVIPSDFEVDLKRLAAAVGENKVRLTTQNEAEQITGLLTGGISPLALINRGFQVVFDELILLYEEIHISGGQRGLNIRMPVKDILTITHATTSQIT